MSDEPNRSSNLDPRVLVGVGAAAVVIVVAVLVLMLNQGGGSADGPPVASPTGEQQPQPEPTEVQEEPEPDVDLEEFETLERGAWESIAADPEAAAGERIVVFAEVRQYDGATGSAMFRAYVGTSHPAARGELPTNTIVTGNPEVLGDISYGDLLRVHAEVTGARGGGGSEPPDPELRAYAVEVIEYRDLVEDVTLGDPVRDGDRVVVPVSIENSSDRTMNYRVDLVAESADGSQQLGAATARVEFLGPDQSANVEATFRQALPSDAVISIVRVERAVSEI